MELGLFLPLVLAFFALTEIPLFMRWRASGQVSETAFVPLVMASLGLPIIAWLVLNVIVPEWGTIEVF